MLITERPRCRMR